MNKGIIKGFVAGFLVCAVMLSVVWSVSVMRELHFGVRVTHNGQVVSFDYDSRPFITENRTFLPVRAIADVLGVEVDFDPVTNMVYLGGRPTTTPPIGERNPNPPFIHPNFDGTVQVRTGNAGQISYLGASVRVEEVDSFNADARIVAYVGTFNSEVIDVTLSPGGGISIPTQSVQAFIPNLNVGVPYRFTIVNIPEEASPPLEFAGFSNNYRIVIDNHTVIAYPGIWVLTFASNP